MKNILLSALLFTAASSTAFAHGDTTCTNSWESCGVGSNLCCPCSENDCNAKDSGCSYKDGSCPKCNTCACYGVSCMCGAGCSPADGSDVRFLPHPDTGVPTRVYKTLEQSRRAS